MCVCVSKREKERERERERERSGAEDKRLEEEFTAGENDESWAVVLQGRTKRQRVWEMVGSKHLFPSFEKKTPRGEGYL